MLRHTLFGIWMSLRVTLHASKFWSRILAVWLDFLIRRHLSFIDNPLIVLHLHYLSLIKSGHDTASIGLFFLGRGGPWAHFFRWVLPADYEIVNFGEYLNIAAIVHHYYVIVVRAVLMNWCLIWRARSDALFLSWGGRDGHPSDTSLLGMSSRGLTRLLTTVWLL